MSITIPTEGWFVSERTVRLPMTCRELPTLGPADDQPLLEAFARATRAAMVSPPLADAATRQACAFLADRGFDLKRLGDLGLGFCADPKALGKELRSQGFPIDELRHSRLLADRRLARCLVGPVRDPQGRIVSFFARRPGVERSTLLYRNPWRHETPAYGLDVALPAVERDGSDLLLVELLLDALALHSHAIENVAALSGSAAGLTCGWWQRITELGVERVTLLIDQEPDAELRVLEALYTAWESRCAAVPPDRIPPPGTFRGYLKRRGPIAFRKLIAEERIHGYRFMARHILKKHRGGEWTDDRRRAALEEAVEFYQERWPGDAPGDLDAFFVPTIVGGLGLGHPLFWLSPEQPFEPPPPPVRSKPPVRPRRGEGPCELHRCDPLACFCFD